MDQFQFILAIFFILLCVNYLILVATDNLNPIVTSISEGFSSQTNDPSDADASAFDWKDNDALYDNFYAEVYDQLVQSSVRNQAKVGLLLHNWQSKIPLDKIEVLDLGCGTGVATVAFAKMNVLRATGVDKSDAMIRRARSVTMDKSTLTPEQKKNVEFKKRDILDPGLAQPGEFNCATMLYFTVYYLNDIEAAFRNLHVWVKPGGFMAIEVVNKHKFDPMLESASPWLAFSLQKYSKERVRKSKVTFDKFDYEGVFDLDDPRGEFRETFRFKDGSVRRQKHSFNMPDMKDIIKKAEITGWKYTAYIDLTSIGFEYAYLLLFNH
jgi:SAM-dependent methyltransferase